MKKRLQRFTQIAIMLFVFAMMLPNIKAQPAPATNGPFGSNISIDTAGAVKYWDGVEWVVVAPGLPGQSLQFTPTWINNSQGIITIAVSSITVTTATSGGNILNGGGAAITARGICWSTSHNPTLANSYTTNGTGIGSFTSNITGLTSGTTYFRAYATNISGTAYGNEVSLIIPFPYYDIDGNGYDTVHIGTQTWMKENLKVTHYSNGEVIPNVTDNTTWSNLATGAYCNYNNDVNNVITYGNLYNWFTVVDSRNLCPTGWHVPNDAEWTTLSNYLGGYNIAGGKLKEAGLAHWNSPNTDATNETGFTSLPGGSRNNVGTYLGIGNYGYWWTTTPNVSVLVYGRFMNYNNSDIYGISDVWSNGYSVRCLKN